MSRPSPPILYRVALSIDVRQHVEGGVDRARVKPGHGAARASTVRQPPELCTLTAVYVYTSPDYTEFRRGCSFILQPLSLTVPLSSQ